MAGVACRTRRGYPPQQRQQQPTVLRLLFVGYHDFCAERERKEEFQRGDVEADRGYRDDRVLSREAWRLAHRIQEVGQRPVLYLHAFRSAGRA